MNFQKTSKLNPFEVQTLHNRHNAQMHASVEILLVRLKD